MKLSHLDQVRLDAKRIQLKRMRANEVDAELDKQAQEEIKAEKAKAKAKLSPKDDSKSEKGKK